MLKPFTLVFSVLQYVSFSYAGNSTFYSGINPCPIACSRSVGDPTGWSAYHEVDRLKLCDRPMLLDFALHTSLRDRTKTVTIRACSVGNAPTLKARHYVERADPVPNSNISLAGNLQVGWKNSPAPAEGFNTGDISNAARQLQQFFAGTPKTSAMFSESGSIFVGAYIGSLARGQEEATSVFSLLSAYMNENQASPNVFIQFCGKDADYTFGAVASSSLAFAQQIVAGWSNATCASGADGTKVIETIQLDKKVKVGTTAPSKRSSRILQPRADCRTIRVVSGDSCGTLASKCGISGADFTKYNPKANLCATLAVGQEVCCSAGTLPDRTPKPNPDGSCATYVVQAGDWCDKIATANSLTSAKLEDFNKKTWGWGGCNNLQAGVKMCLSTGTPPMPAAVANAVCGPQVPGTPKPAAGTDLATLNQCPLNACCNVWGQCGTTPEFCTPSGTGAPGTAAPGTNGCISNCGSGIVNNGSPPSSFISIAYFQGYNYNRPCLNMDVSRVDKKKYTHIHFSFGILTPDYQVDISGVQDQFLRFKQLSGIKRILSFGGWAFSTEPATYMIFRNGVTAANRERFATNVANFLTTHGLDGVDFDWEYPGAPDIPGIPPGSKDDGPNYLAFLRLIKGKLGTKSLAVALPASYWYLKQFPVKDIMATVNYAVYMTYDLHGLWDHSNAFAQPGCPAGNCLRSHINITETMTALSMVTKAGAPANKIIVGVSSYGRSFKMASTGCTGPMCTYVEPVSGAKKGVCTGTSGYIANAEISDILSRTSGARTFKDANSDSNIMVYDSVQWVAYMDDTTKSARTTRYKGLNFGGITDWAVDLQSFSNTDPEPVEDPTVQGAMDPYLEGCDPEQKKKVLEAWQEAGTLAQDQYEWVPGGKWQDAYSLYMGPGSRNDGGFWTGKGPLMKNQRRQYEIHYGWWGSNPALTYAYFYCNEKDNPDGDQICIDEDGDETGTIAYSWDDLGTFWTNHYVVFCPVFFRPESKSLKEQTEYANGRPSVQRNMNDWFETRAITVFHETMHWKNTVSVPRCDLDPEIYEPSEVVALAKRDEAAARINAESYAQAAMAIYLQKTFHLDSPPTPDGRVTPRGRVVTLSKAPNGFVRPVSLDSPTFKPTGANVVSLSSVGDLGGGLKRECQAGVWADRQQCYAFCYDGRCNPHPDPNNKSATCQCSGFTCKNGSYKDFDECHDNCYRGICMESAGIPGVTCSQCP